MPKIEKDYKSMVKRAQEQPGLNDLFKAYNQYDNVAKIARSYLTSTETIIVSDSNSSE